MRQACFIGAGVVGALLAGLGGLLLHYSLTAQAPELMQPEEADAYGMIGRLRPEFILADLEGAPRKVSEWDGKVVILNFWATWCPPCRKEIPAFIQLQTKYGEQGVQFVGIALDDPGNVQAFYKALGINYPILIGTTDLIARSYGNHFGALPYTVIIDRDRRIALARLGELAQEEAEAAIRDLL